MKLKTSFYPFLLLLFGIFIIVVMVSFNPEPVYSQSFFETPTPNADGRILYIVQPGDSCLSISLLANIDINTIRQYNNLDEDCFLSEGQELLLGIYEAPTNAPSTDVTPTPLLPSPTPFNGNGTICIYLFDDINGNSQYEETENPISGGEISITNRDGDISFTGTTELDNQPVCFEDLPEDEYNISVAPPEGYNATTSMNYPLKLDAGNQSIIDFGAQLSSQGEPLSPSEGGRSPMLAIIGGILILGGIGLGIYFRTLKLKQ